MSYGEGNTLEDFRGVNLGLCFFSESFTSRTACFDASFLGTRHLGCGVCCALILFHGKNKLGIGEAHIHELDGNGRVLHCTTSTAINHGQGSQVAVEFTFTGQSNDFLNAA